MSKACCNWCLDIVTAPKDYDRKKQKLYCSSVCYKLDWMFSLWQNDDYLTYMAKKYKEGDDE